jgi:mRNA interferase MazF
MRRGEVWWASLPAPSGSSPGGRRPVLVVQSDHFNRSRIQTVMVVALTTNIGLAEAPGNVLLSVADSGLPRDSVANVSQVLTADRGLLTERVRSLRPELIDRVDEGLRLALALD